MTAATPFPLGDPLALQDEVEALRAANALQERELLNALGQLSMMLEEVERAREKAERDESFQRQTSELLTQIEDCLHDVLIVTDVQGAITRINQRCTEVFGLPRGKIVEMGLDALFTAELIAEALGEPVFDDGSGRSLVIQVLDSRPEVELEITLGRQGGSGIGRPFLLHATLLRSPRGKEEGCILLASDVSQVKAREAALRQRELEASLAITRATIDHIGQGVGVFDRQRKLALWNEQFFKLLELPGELAVPGTDFFAINRCQPKYFGIDEHIKCPCGGCMEWSNIRSARDRILQVTCHPMPDGGFVMAATDMTDIQSKTADIRKLSQAVEAAPVEIVITDAEGVIEYVNPQFTRNTGYSAQEVIGRTPAIVSSGMTPPEVYQSLWTTIRSGEVWRGELLNRTKSGDLIWELLAITPIFNEQREITHFLTVKEDITTTKLANERIRKMATHDQLTGLPNRILFAEKVGEIIAAVADTSTRSAMMFIDLDGFKEVNDRHGHAFGDRLLRAVAQRLGRADTRIACVARFGGDEFAVVLHPQEHPAVAERIARHLVGIIGNSFVIDSIDVQVSASVGVVGLPDHGSNVDTLLGCADMAMYRAKRAGGNQICIFDNALRQAAERRFAIIEGLREALREETLMVHYQPVVAVADGTTVACEALVRWQHPAWGYVSPAEFIPVAEETGLIVDVGRQVLRKVCAQLRQWQDAGWRTVPVSVNLSSVQLTQSGIAEEMMGFVAEFNLAPGDIRFEITESTAIADMEQGASILEILQGAGFKLLLDDFGTGYSSLSYLQRLPVDIVKVDRSFVMQIDAEEKALELTRTVVRLGQILGKKVVAEGVETEAQLGLLREMGCDAVQGYFTGRPQPPGELVSWLKHAI